MARKAVGSSRQDRRAARDDRRADPNQTIAAGRPGGRHDRKRVCRVGCGPAASKTVRSGRRPGPETDTGRCPPGGGVPGIPRCGGGGRSRRRNAALDESSAVRAMARAFSRAWRGSRGERKSSRTIRDAQHLFVQTGHVFLPRRVEFALCQARRFQVSLELAERAQPRADRGRRRTSEEHSITRSTRQLLSALGWGSRTVSTFPASARELFIRGG